MNLIQYIYINELTYRSIRTLLPSPSPHPILFSSAHESLRVTVLLVSRSLVLSHSLILRSLLFAIQISQRLHGWFGNGPNVSPPLPLSPLSPPSPPSSLLLYLLLLCLQLFHECTDGRLSYGPELHVHRSLHSHSLTHQGIPIGPFHPGEFRWIYK